MNNPVIIGNAELYNCDCREILPMLTGIDAVITDPPYFLTDLKLDKESAPADWAMLTKVVQTNGYLAVFAPQTIHSQIEPHWSLRFAGVWVKQTPVLRTHNAKKPPGLFELYVVYAHPQHKVGELTWNQVKVFGEPYKKVQRRTDYKRATEDSLDRACTGGWTQDGFIAENAGYRICPDVLFGNNKTGMAHSERTEHPTQKPLEVMNILTQWLTNQGDFILDPYMGSGTTGVAAVQMDRRFIGIEIDERYFEIACKRIEDAQRQVRMF